MVFIALNEGLRIVETHNLTPIDINIDSIEVISMLIDDNLHCGVIINDCR